MNNVTLTPEQRERYFAILDQYNQFRTLSREEKEDLIVRITSSRYIDLLCDVALSFTIDKATYQKYIVITSQGQLFDISN